MTVQEKINELRNFADHNLNPFRCSIGGNDWSDLLHLIDEVEKEYRKEKEDGKEGSRDSGG